MIDIKETTQKIEDELKLVLDSQKDVESPMKEAIFYSIFPAGKRMRPLMVLGLLDDFKKDIMQGLRAAITIEFLHCASLIHDDLPAFDDDDYRRGRPSCHKAYGQASAILAGDYLPPFALNVLANSDYDLDVKNKLCQILSYSFMELCNGQQLDILDDYQKKQDMLEKIYKLKTGGLFRAVLGFASVIAKKSDKFLKDALELGSEIGVYFQIVDDYIDIFGTKENRGKPVSSDEKNNKITVFSKTSKQDGLNALAEAERKIQKYMEILKEEAKKEGENLEFENLTYFINKIKSRM